MECHLGDVCGDPMPTRPPRVRVYEKSRRVENFVQCVLVCSGLGLYGGLIVVWLVLLFMFFVTPPALASGVQYPMPVPPECVELAEREGVPTLITSRLQRIRAEYKLYRLNARDPLVRQCRDAIERAKAEYAK